MDYSFAADLLSTFRSVHDGVKVVIVLSFFGWLSLASALLIGRLGPARAASPRREPPPPRPALPVLEARPLPPPLRGVDLFRGER